MSVVLSAALDQVTALTKGPAGIMGFEQMVSKGWSASSLLDGLSLVQQHAERLATAELSEEEMARELAVACRIKNVWLGTGALTVSDEPCFNCGLGLRGKLCEAPKKRNGETNEQVS